MKVIKEKPSIMILLAQKVIKNITVSLNETIMIQCRVILSISTKPDDAKSNSP